MKKAPTKRAKQNYRATIYILGKHYVGVGPTVLDAIKDLKPEITRVKGILRIEDLQNEWEKERILTAPMMTRLFALSPLTREVTLKQVSQLFPS